MKVIFSGEWPTDPEERSVALVETAQELIKTTLPMFIRDATPEQFTACKYMISFIHKYPERFDDFDEHRLAGDDGGAAAFQEMYDRINAVTEGDLARVCKIYTEFPLLLGASRAVYVRVCEELDKHVQQMVSRKHLASQDQV